MSAWRRITAWTRNAWAAVTHTVAKAVSWASGVIAGVRERHLERADNDASYRSALASGLTAIISVVTAQPAVAAALGVLVAEHLRTPAVQHRPGPGRRLWDEDWDDDLEDEPLPMSRWGHRR